MGFWDSDREVHQAHGDDLLPLVETHSSGLVEKAQRECITPPPMGESPMLVALGV